MCNILDECNDVIECLEWIQAHRQGINKNDKQNTQLELGDIKSLVRVVVACLIIELNFARLHQSQYE